MIKKTVLTENMIHNYYDILILSGIFNMARFALTP